MMPYVPPHHRSAAAAAPSATQSQNHQNAPPKPYRETVIFNSWLDPPVARGGGGGAGYNGGASYNGGARRPQNSKAALTPEAVVPEWRPSDRVLSFTPDQVEEVRLRLNVDVTNSSYSLPVPAPIESFSDMGLDLNILADINFHQLTRPTSIQAQAIPVALSGRDLLGCAETGSGKTAAFAIPMIQHCLAQPRIQQGEGPLGLVLTPTRVLAQQIEKEVKAFSRSLEWFKTAIVVGGKNIPEQRVKLREGADVVVATPGICKEQLIQCNTSFSKISFVVLDEADRMLDMGFEKEIREVMHSLPGKPQTLLFSATMGVDIEALAHEFLSSPVQVKVGKTSSVPANVTQVLVDARESDKIELLVSKLSEKAPQAKTADCALIIVFVERKKRCDEVAVALKGRGFYAVPFHDGRSESEKEAALLDFMKGNILVATDVASRGLDVTRVAHVINLDLPKDMEDYVGRIAGCIGRATSFFTDCDMILVAQIEEAIAIATGEAATRKERERGSCST